MIDTSALVAALVRAHEHHVAARGRLAAETRIPAIVMAETFSQLRRTFGQTADVATRLLAPWTSTDHILPTSATAMASVLGQARELDMAGNVHDALIAQVCLEHDLPLVTLDRRQHRLARALGCDSTYLA